MKKTWRVLVMLAVLSIPAEIGAETRDYHPVVFSLGWDSGVTLWLMGGFKEGKWYEHTALPVMVNGRAITPEEGIDLDEPAACSTPFIHEGMSLTFYSPEGRKIESRTVKGTKYSCSPASLETFIDVEITETFEVPPGSLFVGVEEGWNAVTAPTRRKAEKENVAFTWESPEPPASLSVTFSPVAGGSEKMYRGVLAWGEKNLELTDVYAEGENELEGFFIDLNGDGRVEFVLYSRNVGGFVSAFELNLDRDPLSAAEVLSLDLGD
jgi:hypothetical protein